MSTSGLCTSYQSDHSHSGTHTVVAGPDVVFTVVLVLGVVVGGSVVTAVDTVVEVGGVAVAGGVEVLEGVGVVVVDSPGGGVVVILHSSTHIWVSSSNIGLSSGHTG